VRFGNRFRKIGDNDNARNELRYGDRQWLEVQMNGFGFWDCHVDLTIKNL